MKNKNLLITGGVTRVGRKIALHFAERGWNIALHYFKSSSKARNLKKIIEQYCVKVVLIKADLKNSKQVEKIIPLAKKQLGTIDCLINNAALFEKDDISNFTIKSWNDHLNINLLAPTILTKQFAKQASKKNLSDIINIIDQSILPNEKDVRSIIDYEKIAVKLEILTKNNKYNFLESLAEDSFKEIFEDKRINSVKIKIEKPNAIKNAGSVGVEVFKSRSDYEGF